MNLQFLSIGTNNGMAVAYFLERTSNTVYMFRVVDMTVGAPAPQPVSYAPNPASLVPPAFNSAPPAEVIPTPPPLPDKRPSIMPPGLRSMMDPENTWKGQ